MIFRHENDERKPFENREIGDTRSGCRLCTDLPILAASSGLFADFMSSTHACARGLSTPTNLCACNSTVLEDYA